MAGRSPGALAPATRAAASATPPFAALLTAPGLARGLVRAALAGWGLARFSEVAELIASELVSNAVQASAVVQDGGDPLLIRVCLLTDGEVLAIEVWDQAPGVPALRDASGLTETGRGLAIIDALTSGRWGCQPAPRQPGKCTWAEIPLRGEPGQRLIA